MSPKIAVRDKSPASIETFTPARATTPPKSKKFEGGQLPPRVGVVPLVLLEPKLAHAAPLKETL
jgi:hypothetical protein